MQELSYPIQTDHIDFEDFQASVEVFSFENLYFPVKGSYEKKGNTLTSNRIVWGDEEFVKGNVSLSHKKENGKHVLSVSGELEQNVRSIKLRIDGLPIGKLLSTIDFDKQIDENGLQLTYPEGWRGLQTPLLVFDCNGRYLVIRSLADKVKTHIFYMRAKEGKMRVDVVYEEDATAVSNKIASPDIEVYFTDNLKNVYEEQNEYIRKTYDLVKYEKREDVPAWFRDVSLVVICHMEAYTGKVFHTYQKAKEDILKLTEHIDGKHILVYLPGWEGRYYFKYGNYTPDDRLGGEEGLLDMVNSLHEKGVRVMAMYGMTIVNNNTYGYEKWGKPAEFYTCGGGHFHSGSVDWEGAHHYDDSFMYQLNVGVKEYQDYLFNQIKTATDKYGFDAAFLDIAACHVNDRNRKHYDGLIELCARLRTIKKDFLVSGEGYYDGCAKAMPLFQSGHTDGDMHYHDRPDENMFGDYSREFSHLCLGDFSRLSTGTHELGINPTTKAPYRKSIIPTLCLVDGTIEKSFGKVKEVIDDAVKYKEEFLDD